MTPPRAGFLSLLTVLAIVPLSTVRATSEDPAGPGVVAPTQEAESVTPTYVETVTVTATSNPTPVQEVAGTVGRVDRSQIDRQLMTNSRDLLRFEPGVEVTGDPTRLGLGGFVIRGIGGNRVETRVDGVPVAEDFAFGPLGMVRFTLDPELLESVEVLRSAGSSLYGSDALGGVVSLVTRDPEQYLRDELRGLGGRVAYDDRSASTSASGFFASRMGNWSTSLAVDAVSGHETSNQGESDAENATRTVANPSDRESFGGLGKLVHRTNDRFDWRVSAERYDAEAETEVYSGRTTQNLGPVFGPGVTYTILTGNLDAVDRQERTRLAGQALAQVGGIADTLFARAYYSANETDQRVDELVTTTQGGGPFGPTRVVNVRRDGTFRVQQDLTGIELQARKGLERSAFAALLTYGAEWERNAFDMLRDRKEFDAATRTQRPAAVLVPTKYFPASDVDTLGAYLQAEVELAGGRLRLVPGVRYDRSELTPDVTDPIFLSGNPGTPLPVEAEADALSPKLGAVYAATDRVALFAQYSAGFRTPPYSSVNNGFSNVASRYRTLPNADLEPETSDNLEVGARFSANRGSLSVTLFENDYAEFIEQVALGTSPVDGFLEYQYRNLTSVEIHGVEIAGDQRLGEAWRLRGALAWIEGENRESERPLNSIAPPKGVLGLDWTPAALPFDAGLVVSYIDAKDVGDIDRSAVQQFATPDATIVDLFAGYRLTDSWSIRAALLNALDETYWTWGEVGGLATTSAVLDRYTAPGRSASISVRFGH